MTIDNKFFLIIDFEATCSNNTKEIPRNEMEIIEFAGILINTNFDILKEFTKFVKPVRHPLLTKFCIELTSITQNDVEIADEFTEIIKLFNNEMLTQQVLFLSWGNYDKDQLMQDCQFHNIKYPFDENNHINIKKMVCDYLEFKKQRGISGVLKFLNLRFEGIHHRGIDDVRNIIRILKHINYPMNSLLSKI